MLARAASSGFAIAAPDVDEEERSVVVGAVGAGEHASENEAAASSKAKLICEKCPKNRSLIIIPPLTIPASVPGCRRLS